MNKFLDKLEEPISDYVGNFWGIRVYAILITLLLALSLSSCSHAQEKLPPLKELNPYEQDASGENFDWDYDGAILIVPSNVISFTYNTQDNEYIIQYDDPDCFDIDYMTYSKDDDYWYIEITCDSNLFFDYFAYYNSLGGYKDPKFNEASTVYFIEEDFLKNGDSYYKLVKYGTDKEINQ
jgi:hypothetical protein